MKKALIIIFLLNSFLFSGQKGFKFYDIDSVIKVKAKVINIKQEKTYKRNNFIIIYLKELKTGRELKAEVSPFWFFNLDINKGSLIEIQGSKIKYNNKDYIITKSIIYKGEIYEFRDKLGFPLWRGKRYKSIYNENKNKRRRGKY